MGMIKYIDELEDETGQSRFWGRLDVDGLPFRGPNAPMLKSEEYEDHLERVNDAKVNIFVLNDPEQRKEYADILDRISNGWYSCLLRRVDIIEGKHVAYIEWTVRHVELPKRFYHDPTYTNHGTEA